MAGASAGLSDIGAGTWLFLAFLACIVWRPFKSAVLDDPKRTSWVGQGRRAHHAAMGPKEGASSGMRLAA